MDLEKHYGTIARIYNWLDNRDLPVGLDLINAVRILIWELLCDQEGLSRLTSKYKLTAHDKLHTDAVYCGLFSCGANDMYNTRGFAIFDGESFYSLLEAMQGKISAPIRIGRLDFGHCQFCDFARLIMAAENKQGKKPAYDLCQNPTQITVSAIDRLTGNTVATFNAASRTGWMQDSTTITIPPAFASEYRQLAYSTNWGTRQEEAMPIC